MPEEALASYAFPWIVSESCSQVGDRVGATIHFLCPSATQKRTTSLSVESAEQSCSRRDACPLPQMPRALECARFQPRRQCGNRECVPSPDSAASFPKACAEL